MKILQGACTISELPAFLDRLQLIRSETETTIQAFDASYVVSESHLRRAVELADRAIEREANVADDRAVEILLYAAGRRQITDALEMGVSEGRDPQPVVFVVDAARSGGPEVSSGEAVSDAVDRVRSLIEPKTVLGSFDPGLVDRFFDISAAELKITDGDREAIVLERVALLDVEK
ncbi:MAG: KEOPS complex subunit Cgi121 [Halobacteriota archaeon]